MKMKFKNKTKRIADIILTVFFPKRCVCCGKVIALDELFCENCDVQKHRIAAPRCKVCGQEEMRCCCGREKHAFDRLIAPFYYEEELRDSIRNLKYRSYIDNGRFLAGEMVKALNAEVDTDEIDLITAVPMTNKRKKHRGFSQTELLAGVICEETGIKFEKTILKKIKDTPPQVGLDSKQRKKNLIGTIKISKNADVKGKTVIICDDNKTTGATLDECAKLLKSAGAKQVIALTAALSKNRLRGEAD